MSVEIGSRLTSLRSKRTGLGRGPEQNYEPLTYESHIPSHTTDTHSKQEADERNGRFDTGGNDRAPGVGS